MDASTVYSAFKRENTVFLSVPTSGFKNLLSFLEKKKEVTYCSNEEEILGMGAGLALCDKVTIALIQHSGFGKVVNVYLSLNKLYKLPILFVIDSVHRGRDAPEHLYMGKSITRLLQAAGLEFRQLGGGEEKLREDVNYALSRLSKGESFVLLDVKGVIDG